MARGQPRQPRWWAVWTVLALACGTPAPKAHEPVPYVLTLESGGRSGRGQSAWLADVVAQGLDDARWFRPDGEGPALTATLVYDEWTIDDEVPVLRAHLVVEPDAVLATELGALGLELDAYVELERKDRTIELRRDLPFAVERALAIIDAKVTVARGDEPAVASLLDDPDPEVVVVGLDGVHRRHLVELGDRVVELLAHHDDRVGLAAVECLGVIGRPEHAAGLVRTARLADRAYANRVYDALANLGGEHARGFLAFAARNEEDPELASLAEQALARLDAKEPRGALAGADPIPRGHRQ